MFERTVLMFHGLGGDASTMRPVIDYCSTRLPNTSFLPIEGPVNLGDENSPCMGWFEPPSDEARDFSGPNPPNLTGIRRSLASVHAAIDQLVGAGAHPQNIHLLGHSQGGAIAITAGLTYPEALGSICTVAGYLALTSDMQPSLSGQKFFLHHSVHDDNVGFRWAGYAKSFLESNGNSCVVQPWHIVGNPHAMHAQQLDAICETITNA